MTPEQIISIASVVIALSALFLSIWQGYLSRKHNKISVKPHLVIFSKHDEINNNVEVDIQNNGLGPAVITLHKIFCNKVEFNFDVDDKIKTILDPLLDGCKYNIQSGQLADEGNLLPAEECFELLKLTVKSQDDPNFSLREAVDKLDILIEYESMYGEKFTLDTRE